MTTDTDRLPPAPSLPSELLAYPPKEPDWVDKLAMRCAMAAVNAVRDHIEGALVSRLEAISDAVTERLDRTDKRTAELAAAVEEVRSDSAAIRVDIGRLRDEHFAIERRLRKLEELEQRVTNLDAIVRNAERK